MNPKIDRAAFDAYGEHLLDEQDERRLRVLEGDLAVSHRDYIDQVAHLHPLSLEERRLSQEVAEGFHSYEQLICEQAEEDSRRQLILEGVNPHTGQTVYSREEYHQLVRSLGELSQSEARRSSLMLITLEWNEWDKRNSRRQSRR